jgi:hypothetical protein
VYQTLPLFSLLAVERVQVTLFPMYFPLHVKVFEKALPAKLSAKIPIPSIVIRTGRLVFINIPS